MSERIKLLIALADATKPCDLDSGFVDMPRGPTAPEWKERLAQWCVDSCPVFAECLRYARLMQDSGDNPSDVIMAGRVWASNGQVQYTAKGG